jgi:hypothetical protein
MSMEDLEPLSPSDAARILAGQRWNRDEASGNAQPEGTGGEEPTYYGREGVERSQNFEPMRPAHDVKQAAAEALDSSEVRQQLQEAQEIAPPVEINYLEGGNPEKPIASNQTVSPEQAASDLSRFRENIGEQIEAAEAQQIRDAIDQLRAGDQVPEGPIALDLQVQPQPDAQQPQQPEAPQPEASQVPTSDDEAVRKALADPRVLHSVQETINSYAAEAQRAQQAYAQAVQYNAQSAAANLVATFPELRGLNSEEAIVAAVNAIGHTNPARRQEILSHFDRVRNLTAEAQRVQAAQQQAWAQQQQAQQASARQQFDVAARNADLDFNAYAKTQVSDEQFREIQKEAVAMLHDYGLTEQEVAWQYNNNWAMRSLPAQKLMFDAARWRMSQRAIKEKAARPSVPQVQKPGVSGERASASEYEFKSLNDKVNRLSGRQQIQAAADLIAARRRRG